MKNELFRQIVDDRDIDLEELADVADLSLRTVKEYYSGVRKIGWKQSINLMKILDLTEEDVNADNN